MHVNSVGVADHSPEPSYAIVYVPTESEALVVLPLAS